MEMELDDRITYTENGNVFRLHRRVASLASGDISEGTTEEWAAAARGYFGYCGTLEVDEERGFVTHIVALRSVPNWTDQRQVRHVDLAGDRLELSGPPTLIASTTRTARLTMAAYPSRACGATAR